MADDALCPLELAGRDAADPGLRAYRAQLHPDDVESLDALLELDGLHDAHAILRWRNGNDSWRLVEHRIARAEGSVPVLTRVDVTDRERRLERAGRTEAYWRTVLRNGHEAIAVLDPESWRITHASDRLADLLGRSAEGLVGSRAAWHVDRRDLPTVRSLRSEGFHDGRAVGELRLRRAHAPSVWMEAVVSDARGDSAVGALVVNLREIEDRKRAEERLLASEHLFRVLVQHLADGAIVVDEGARITFITDRAAQSLGQPGPELVGTTLPLVVVGDWLQLGTSTPIGPPPVDRLPAEVRGPSGDWFLVTPHDLSDDPVVAGRVLVLRDVTEGRVRVERLRRQVERDALTGLLNRRGFESRLTQHLDDGRSVGIGFLDLDGFKAVNDTHGHAFGDALLREVAHRLETCVRPGDDVARFGGDEFVLAFADPPTEAGLIELTNRILARVAGDYRIEGRVLTVGVSAGWSLANPGVTAAEALRRADHRMYEQKRRIRD